MAVVTKLVVTGMSCNHCTRAVDLALRALPGVSIVEVALPDAAVITHDHTTSLAQLVSAVESVGYGARHA
jgi:copper chaperone CopZ